MIKRILLIGLSLVLAGALLLGCAGPVAPPAEEEEEEEEEEVQVQTIKVQTLGGPTYICRIEIEEANKLIEERSDGRIKVDYYPGGTLFTGREAFDAGMMNILQYQSQGYGGNTDVLGIAADIEWLPMAYDYEPFTANFRNPGGLEEFVQPYWEAAGLYLLDWQISGMAQWYWTFPVIKAEDFAGSVAYCMPGPVGMEFGKNMGVSCAYIDTAEWYTSLERGTITGIAMISPSLLISTMSYKVANYIYWVGSHMAGLGSTANLEWLDSLSPDLREMVISTFLELEKKYFAAVPAMIQTDIDFFEADPDVHVYHPPAEERAKFRDAMKPIYADLAETYPQTWPVYWEISKSLRK